MEDRIKFIFGQKKRLLNEITTKTAQYKLEGKNLGIYLTLEEDGHLKTPRDFDDAILPNLEVEYAKLTKKEKKAYDCVMPRRSLIFLTAIARATKPPIMLAVRVPPSASITSQSTTMAFSPRAARSAAPRSERPTKRWISCVRPLAPLRSRSTRLPVLCGSKLYSAVIQPVPRPASQSGTFGRSVALQMTRVRPISMRTEPSALEIKPVVILRLRYSSGFLSVRV